MKKQLYIFIRTYLLFVVVFIIQKPLFMWYYHGLFTDANPADYIQVMLHGLPLDLSIAGYLSVIPALLQIVSLWLLPHFAQGARRVYFALISFVMATVFVSDMALYSYWGFRLDSTPLFYFFSSPKDALASVGIGIVIAGFAIMAVLTVLFYLLFFQCFAKEYRDMRIPLKRGRVSIVLLLVTAALFIPIRGGFSVSTMNISRAYFSEKMSLNHAAINPMFSLLESVSRESDFKNQYRFMEADKADALFQEMKDAGAADSIPQLFNQKRPNVVFIILESFMSKTMTSLKGLPDVAVNMDKFAEEGVLFTNFYANSFRTDRGLVAILSGYPAQPTTSIMKYPRKTESLPSIPRSLKANGYNLQYYYGGDANFTNMRSYLVSTGINDIVSDKDFPITERLSKWGAHDHVVFNRMIADLLKEQKEPFMKILQTSSSHEPYEVPYHKLSNPYLNSVAYADSCLGRFIAQFKQTKWWKNSVVVLVPDHARRYPDNLSDFAIERYQIPLILIGGAVKQPTKVSVYASQIDLAATLLSQLQMKHDEFAFSKNIMNPASPHFAYFTFPNMFGMVTEDNAVVFNCEGNKVVSDTGRATGKNLEKGKAFLQKLYDDLAAR
ncbi:MAG: sulfatase-like hydrolase/transferase [Bacteroides graminisolvens]|nr:sulfatase-like hydrolase/transferase [Bacteroides graminisolvens]